MDPTAWAREDIRSLRAYEHAAWDPRYERLHANELPWRMPGDRSVAGLNRYPEPHPHALEAQLARQYAVDANQVLAGRGSDEAIDLLVRAWCTAGRDQVVLCPPTFGMYAVAARIQGAGIVPVALRREQDYAPDLPALLRATALERTRLVFLCSPNNPTGQLLADAVIERVLEAARGHALVVVDEAYIEFSGSPGWSARLSQWPHLVVLRTLSKAFGLAGARVGALIADPRIVALLRTIIPPYAIAQPSQEAALDALRPAQKSVSAARIAAIVDAREKLTAALTASPAVERVWPSSANFLLVDFHEPERAATALREQGLIVRAFPGAPGLERSLRITVGSAEQNQRIIEGLR